MSGRRLGRWLRRGGSGSCSDPAAAGLPSGSGVARAVTSTAEERGQRGADLELVVLAAVPLGQGLADLAQREVGERLQNAGAVDPRDLDPARIGCSQPDLAQVVGIVVDRPLTPVGRVPGQLPSLAG